MEKRGLNFEKVSIHFRSARKFTYEPGHQRGEAQFNGGRGEPSQILASNQCYYGTQCDMLQTPQGQIQAQYDTVLGQYFSVFSSPLRFGEVRYKYNTRTNKMRCVSLLVYHKWDAQTNWKLKTISHEFKDLHKLQKCANWISLLPQG